MRPILTCKMSSFCTLWFSFSLFFCQDPHNTSWALILTLLLLRLLTNPLWYIDILVKHCGEFFSLILSFFKEKNPEGCYYPAGFNRSSGLPVQYITTTKERVLFTPATNWTPKSEYWENMKENNCWRISRILMHLVSAGHRTVSVYPDYYFFFLKHLMLQVGNSWFSTSKKISYWRRKRREKEGWWVNARGPLWKSKNLCIEYFFGAISEGESAHYSKLRHWKVHLKPVGMHITIRRCQQMIRWVWGWEFVGSSTNPEGRWSQLLSFLHAAALSSALIGQWEQEKRGLNTVDIE